MYGATVLSRISVSILFFRLWLMCRVPSKIWCGGLFEKQFQTHCLFLRSFDNLLQFIEFVRIQCNIELFVATPVMVADIQIVDNQSAGCVARRTGKYRPDV